MKSLRRGLAGLALLAVSGTATAQSADTGVKDFERDLRVYTAHVTYLANDFMEGRVPGSKGMEIARDYAEHFLAQAGLEPAFATEETLANGTVRTNEFSSFRQAFPLGGTLEVKSSALRADTGNTDFNFEAERDYTVTGLGGSGDFTGDAVFVGYSIGDGPDGFSSYGEGDDLTGKIAVMYRFEPMDAEGNSTWSEGDGWSDSASFAGKLRNAFERGAEAALVINTPFANDDRIDRLDGFRGSGRGGDKPVMMVSAEAGKMFLDAVEGHDAESLWAAANEGGGIIDLGTTMAVKAELEREVLNAENVGGILRGKGDLADEWIVVGAHLDHIGMGYFGSRSGSGTLHPGADDNASGSAAILLLADLVGRSYAELPDDADARSVLFMLFDAEESGLNGSRYYSNNPIIPIEDHAVMVNFDMIGRVLNDRLIVSGMETGSGLKETLQPILDNSGLEIVTPANMSGASDHTSFYQKNIPVLFSIIADFHTDYHTPGDTAWKLNNPDTVRVSHMYHDIIMKLGTLEERPEFVKPQPRQSANSGMGNIKVRFGVMPDYNAGDVGITIGGVTEGTSAGLAGVQEGDVLVRWDGQKILDIEDWMGKLAEHEPGDVVNVGVKRDGEEITLEVTLQGK
ncbi:MAG: M28 family peptidase [Phycisphaerales bacterium JB061]